MHVGGRSTNRVRAFRARLGRRIPNPASGIIGLVSLSEFIQELFETGRVKVPPPDMELPGTSTIDSSLNRAEATRAADMPGDPPEFKTPLANWAASMVFRACQALIDRTINQERLAASIGVAYSGEVDASAHYSVDLVLRYMPDLLRLSKQVSDADPLNTFIMQWATDWPLSSVGIPDVQVENLDVILEHPSLKMHYIDRVIERQDLPRLEDPRVHTTILNHAGMYHDLLPDPVRNHLYTLSMREAAD